VKITEQAFQNATLVALSRADAVRVWRQNAGDVVAARGGVVKGMPKGAADVGGIVLGRGWLLQVEFKMPGRKRTEQQERWADMIEASGGVYVLAEYNAALSLADNVAHVCHLVEQAIEERADECAREVAE
jgi:hypothetical protein